MDFQRIDKNTVQCRMTEEEMNSYGFAIEDFFTNQERSREFLESIVEKAEEEIGYEIESGMVSMQLMRMPDNSLTITFTDRGEDAIHNMLNQIQNLAGMLDESNMPGIIANGLAQDKCEDKIEDLSEAATDETKSVSMDEFQKDNSVTTEKQKKAYREHIKELEKKKKAIVLLPSEPIEISRYEKDSDTLMAIYDMGYTDAMKRMNEIKAMIAEHSTQTVSVEG